MTELRYSSVSGDPYVYDGMKLETGDEIAFIARSLRDTATGVHGFLGIAVNGEAIADHTFNLTNAKEQVWLANQAFSKLNQVRQRALPKNQIQSILGTLCREAWGVWQGQLESEEIAGDLSIRPAEFVLKPYIVKGGGTIIYGPPGRGKSYLCMSMAVMMRHLAEIDQVYLHWTCEQMTPLYINLERSRESMTARLARVNLALGLPPERTLRFLHARGRPLKDISEAVKRAAAQNGVNLLFLDSISRAGLGDLKENQPANAIIDILNGLGLTWVAIGHSPREGDHLYGSMFFEAGADVVVGLKSEHEPGRDLGMMLEIEKGNDLPVFTREYIGMQFDDDGLAAIYKAKDTAFPELAGQRKVSFEGKIVAYLEDVTKATAGQVANALHLDRANVSRFLNTNSQIVDLGRAKEGKFYGLASERESV